jgi:predicted SnoaL-like aldol condensation-catalyzing enzyme
MMQAPSTLQMFDSFVAAAGAVAHPDAARVAANTVLVTRYFDMWNTGDGSVADAVLGPTYLDHAHPEVLGPAAFRSLVPRFRAANPGARMQIEIAAADDELVAVRNAISRKVDGAVVESRGIALFRVAGGKLAEQWSWYPDAGAEAAHDVAPVSFEAWLSFRA